MRSRIPPHRRPIPRSSPQTADADIDHLRETLGAINVELTPADLRELDEALSRITVHGGRMNEPQMRVVDRPG
jgi:hypothetical protein